MMTCSVENGEPIAGRGVHSGSNRLISEPPADPADPREEP